MKRLFFLLAASAALLCGCGADAPQDEPQLPADGQTLLIIDGREIPAWRYLCWLEQEWAAVQTGTASFDAADAAAVKEQALLDTAVYAAVETMAAQYGLSLTAEEAAVTTAWPTLSASRRRELAQTGALYAKLCTLVSSPESLHPAHSASLTAFAAGCITLESILIPPGEGAQQRAAEIFAAVNSGGESAFNRSMAQSADTAGKRTFLPGDGILSSALENAAATLEEGHFSGILESEEGFSILLRLPTELTDVALRWLDEHLLTLAESADIQTTPEYENLDVNGFQ